MEIKAYAKINISLDVVGKRDDGYHLLKMIMQQIELYDLINIEKCYKGISIKCNKEYVPTDERNLAYKAAKLFLDTYKIDSGVNINIHKNIPVAAGLAGGSTDAAAVLKAMRKLFNVDVNNQELMKLGLKIGADVPYCITGGTALCEGIGEIITPLNAFKGHILVLVKPNFGVSTKNVYKSLDINKIIKHVNTQALIESISHQELGETCKYLKNVLENVTLKKYHTIRNIKDGMIRYGALGSLMSGSGPTVYGFFDDMLKAQKCYDIFKSKYDDVFITRTI
ncbi:4-diphosphocytidyl-2-C-methyl-D-erythritol kinase [Clostridium tepidiprofundi DSM 19306]|uniref:4-diphosphocytidyl-2-C-methyl-D-erythritol kinase n=1 Tax=Clostridium tepidiprofundi DSM 19306 TaxID=1121338 RepID=A0A151B562_9CLOT|nr:4-(cytidine 5'-diphospho)-2-C-methyl-D-erythritol kinase [Clostridium tepidiprofundi]KYH34943.1 4-diphosphocytidyl-2-C-methyl-D-erythritol kinase [Clostridium tepidiprofundi DSM 19306]